MTPEQGAGILSLILNGMVYNILQEKPGSCPGIHHVLKQIKKDVRRIQKIWLHITCVPYHPVLSMEHTKIFKDHPFLSRTLKLALPSALVAAELVFLYFFLGPASFFIVAGLMVAYILPPAGKETVIPAGILLGIPWWLMALSIMMIDIETALFMGWNFDLALKIPVLGRVMESFIEKADQFIKDKTWLKKLYFTGIVVLVMMPVMGSGGIRGTIIGNLLGMAKIPLFLAIVTGAFIGCFGIALATVFLQELFLRSILLGTAVVAGIIIIAFTAWYLRKAYSASYSPAKK